MDTGILLYTEIYARTENVRLKCQVNLTFKSSYRRENRIMDEYFVTVFPKQEGEMPQDFSSYAEAKKFADEEYGEGNYIIESPCY